MTQIIDPIIEEPVEEPTPEPSDATYERVDDYTVRRTRPEIIRQEVVAEYDLDFLYAQEIAIVQQRDEMISAKTRELAEVREAIAAAEAAGVKRKSLEEVPVE